MDYKWQDLNRDIINRRAGGKTIWQPRIGCWYDDRVFRNEDFPGKYKGCDHTQLYEKLGCSNRVYDFNECIISKTDESVKYYSREIDEYNTETTIETPEGSINSIIRRNTSNPGSMPMKWLVETEDDLKVMTYIEEATSWSFDYEAYERLQREVGHLGLPSFFVPRVNMQKMFIEHAGVENTIYLLQDSPDYLEEYFGVLSESQMKLLRVAAESPIEWINYGDNLHCKILPPFLFERYLLPEYEKRWDILHKAGKFVFSHWDGDCRDYLKYAKTCFLDGIEAVTPLPQGDVTLREVKNAFGDEIFLIDGIAAILFNDTYPVEALKEQVNEALTLFEGQLILGISDELPSDGLLERVELVRDMVEQWNLGK